MTTNYQNDDQKGRDLFRLFCSQQSKFTFHREARQEFAKWDVSYYLGKQQFIGEIKVRDYNCDAFGTWYLQADKLEALQALQKKAPNTKISYINFYNDNMMRIWNLSDLDLSTLEFSMQKLQKNDYEKEEVWKKVYHLNNIDAEPYETDLTKSIFKDLAINQEEDNFPF
jgi:hypothetical protein